MVRPSMILSRGTSLVLSSVRNYHNGDASLNRPNSPVSPLTPPRLLTALLREGSHFDSFRTDDKTRLVPRDRIMLARTMASEKPRRSYVTTINVYRYCRNRFGRLAGRSAARGCLAPEAPSKSKGTPGEDTATTSQGYTDKRRGTLKGRHSTHDDRAWPN